tara:strand:+ start:8942 stop:10075 length:1134 start_codon:yes stop_codon:yes gene_type:complete
MFCPNCNKDIDHDALFCPDCGTNLKKPEENISQDKPIEEITHEPVKKKFSFKDHKTKLFTAITLSLLLVLMFLMKPGKIIPVDVDLEFSIYQENYTKIVMPVLYFNSNTNFSSMEKLFELSYRYNIPYTAFIAADALSDEEFMKEFTDISKKSRVTLNIESAGYEDIKYNQLEYNRQETLIKNSKRLFKDNGIKITGFFPISFSYDYNTILAAENNNIKYITLPSNEANPYHPMSPLEMKMSILIFPLYQDNNWVTRNNGTFSVLMNPDGDLISYENLFRELKKDNIMLTTMNAMNQHIRTMEKMEAEITTDYKKLRSNIRFFNTINNTRIDFKTMLKPRNITLNNASTDWQPYGEGFYIFLNENDKRVLIEWQEIN